MSSPCNETILKLRKKKNFLVACCPTEWFPKLDDLKEMAEWGWGKEQLMDQELFNPQSSSVSSSRIIYTPSTFARTSLLHLQEVGSLLYRSVWRGRTFLWGANLSVGRRRLCVHRLPKSVQSFDIWPSLVAPMVPFLCTIPSGCVWEVQRARRSAGVPSRWSNTL